MPDIYLTDADGLANNELDAMLVLLVTRQQIESGRYASVLEQLYVMCDKRESVLRYRESMVLQVSGYDEDPRELPEIPEVRQFFARLNQEWPHWQWFIARGMGSIALLFSLLCSVKIHRSPAGFGTEFLDSRELLTCFRDMSDRSLALFRAFNIDPELVRQSIESAGEELVGGDATAP